MADEAFALSPISARAALPGEEDYAAISEAFMETSRGRWFLTEYAKRNRNADTRMVLDAVARIEQSLAAQKEETVAAQRESLAAQQQAAATAAATSAAEASAAAAAAANSRLAEALAAIRSAVEAAQASTVEALDSLALEQRLAPVRKGARVLREIAWRLREIGNDGRICDLIDSQVAVIETGAQQITADEAQAALIAAFAALQGRLAEFDPVGRAAAPAAEAFSTPAAETVAASPSPAPPEAPPAASAGMPTATAETIEAATTEDGPEASANYLAEPTEAALAEAETALAQTEAREAADVTEPGIADPAADAHDEAILDMIAMEMGAPDPIDDDEIVAAVAEPAHFAEPAVLEQEVEQQVVAEAPEAAAAPAEPPVEMPTPAVEAASASAMEVSLGSSIIASGMLSKPAKAANDPLAPIRRMSQAEKVAFFS